MMSEQDIVSRLEKLGYKNAEVRMALRDVGQIIVTRTAAAYLSNLPENLQAQLRELSQEGAGQYLSEQQDSLPKMPQEEFEKIHDETWEEYFEAMSQ